jgi:hypothetical protein
VELENQARWAHLVNAAFHLEETKNVSGALDSVLEAFDANIEPVEDFPGYAVRRLVLALRETLTAPR